LIHWKALGLAVVIALLIIAAIVGFVFLCAWVGPVVLIGALALLVFGVLVWAIYNEIVW
jgi:hypothetical protein